MTLEDLIKIKESLEELDADVETFDWGPSLEFARQRKQEALRLINREIKRLNKEKREDLKTIRSQLGYSRIGRNNV